MAEVRVVFYREDDRTVPVLDWITGLIPKAQIKCLAGIKRHQQWGHELRRPETDYLEQGIYELRVGLQGINYRILYFFQGHTAAVLSQGLVKERLVPSKKIERAIGNKRKFEQDPEKHTYTAEV